MYVKTATSGNWNTVSNMWVKTGTSGNWSLIKNVWAKTSTSGNWSLVYSSAIAPSIETRVDISLSTNTDKTIKLTGTLYHWNNATGVKYTFSRSTDNTSYTKMVSPDGTSTNPATGSSNTNDTYTLTQSDVIANTTNYYTYSSTASNSTYSTSQVSTSDNTTLEGCRDITDLSTSNAKASSVDLSWSYSVYSGRQQILYRTSAVGTTAAGSWQSFAGVTGTTTSATVTGLSASTKYDFKIIPWTGTTNSGATFTGYYGNDSNVVSESTTANPIGALTVSATSTVDKVTWTATFGTSTDSAYLEYGNTTSYDNISSIGTDGGSYTSKSYSLSSSNSPIYWRLTPYNATTKTYGTAVTGSTKLTMPTPTFGTVTSTTGGYTVSITNYNKNYNLSVTVDNSSTRTLGTPSGSNLPITVSIPNSNSTTVTAYNYYTNYNSSDSATASGSKKAAFVSPGAPTSPLNSYIGYSGGSFNYTASWTAPSTGTTPFEYFIQVWGASSGSGKGSGGTYVGTFPSVSGSGTSSTSLNYSSTYAYNYFQVFARNYDGSSYYLSANSVSSDWA